LVFTRYRLHILISHLGYGDLNITLDVAAFAFQPLGDFIDSGIDFGHAVLNRTGFAGGSNF
jgi:hypothetical protein